MLISPSLAPGLELVCEGDVVAEPTISRHLDSDDSSENRPRVDSDPHLQQRKIVSRLICTKIFPPTSHESQSIKT